MDCLNLTSLHELGQDLFRQAIFSSSQTALTDTGLTQSTEYFYKVYTVDITSLWTGSNEVSGSTENDSPPEAVDLFPVVVEPDHYSEINIEWSQSSDLDFGSYRLYRWQEDIGRDDSVLVAFVSDRSAVTYTDHPSFSTTADTLNFWYIVQLYDQGENVTPSDSVRVHLVDDAPAQVSGTVVASDSSLVVTWSQTDIPDFGSYRLLRDVDSNPTGALTVFVSSDQSVITFDDESTVEGQTYYYWLDIYDLRSNYSRSLLGSGAW